MAATAESVATAEAAALLCDAIATVGMLASMGHEQHQRRKQHCQSGVIYSVTKRSYCIFATEDRQRENKWIQFA
jgi:hypothetical protein